MLFGQLELEKLLGPHNLRLEDCAATKIFKSLEALKMNSEGNGNTGAIDRLPRVPNSDVVHLRPQGDVGEKSKVHSAAKAVSKVVGVAQPGEIDMRAPDHALHEGTDARRVAEHQARTEQVCIGVRGHASRRCMVGAKIASNAEPMVVHGDRATDAVLIEAIGIAQTKVRIAYGSVGLRVRRNGEE